ncbi:uncharacterized protein LY79DRAFT_572660 [Colletotrichum navitas]|uniref:Secreted protein n=1 Tax=Colletotrichum navitas TaxID=681940 RepID=A0AAD8UYJ9_9PEZI|nr:uncharacterized protein LY79DRAFT_572660 [Colletotrichum navitas]KAK1566120.1 hypothetical protein LY79DRAFT_572660 [Colletotrichum navitas]
MRLIYILTIFYTTSVSAGYYSCRCFKSNSYNLSATQSACRRTRHAEMHQNHECRLSTRNTKSSDFIRYCDAQSRGPDGPSHVTGRCVWVMDSEQ